MGYDFLIRQVKSEADREAVRALLRDGFEVKPGVGRSFATLYDQVTAHLDPDCSQVAVVEGQVVGHILLVPRFFSLHGVSITGGIAAMAVVAKPWRGQGIGNALMHNLESLARQKQMAMLHLAGDLNYYRRFLYVESYLRCRAELSAREGPAFELRTAKISDAVDLARLSGTETPTGALVADADRWRWVLKTGHPAGLLKVNDVLLGFCAREDYCWVLQQEGSLRGVVRAAVAEGELAIYESAVENDRWAEQMLNMLRQWAWMLQCHRVRFWMPPGNRLMQAVGRAGGEIRVEQDPELLVKFVDIPFIVNRLGHIFAERVQNWPEAESIALCTDRLCLFADRNGLRTCGPDEAGRALWKMRLPEIGLIRAFLGADRLAGRMGGGDRPVDLVDALFPAGEPFFWLADSL